MAIVPGTSPGTMINVASNEVGYLGKKSNNNLDDKTANAGKGYYTKYGKWFGMNGVYWCAIFVSWCFYSAYGTDKGKLLLNGYTASAETLRQQFITNNKYDKNPKAGDCIFYSGTRHYGANHTGIVYKVDSQYVYTIEGNTSDDSVINDNGGCVAKKQFSKSTARIMGYGHPEYSSSISLTTIEKSWDLVAYQKEHGGNIGVTTITRSSNIKWSKGTAQATLYSSSNVWYDDKGFCRYMLGESKDGSNDPYVVALGSLFGSGVGEDFFRITVRNKTSKNTSTFKVLLGDQKADKDTDSTNAYTVHSGDYVEFEVNNNMKDNPHAVKGTIVYDCEFIKIEKYSDASLEDSSTSDISTLSMQQRISTLISSDNYSFIEIEEKEKKETLLDKLKNAIEKIKQERSTGVSNGYLSSDDLAVSDEKQFVRTLTLDTNIKNIKRTKRSFDLKENTVEAPFIILIIDDITIGSFSGTLDNYPNYIQSMTVEKTNGEINKYNISLVHQIQRFDDPNSLDEVFSRINYNKIIIKYGDSCTGKTFNDAEAYITNVTMNRNYANSCITYNIEATSAGFLLSSTSFYFPATTSKPSTLILDLLYNNKETSPLLLETFTNMKSKTEVLSSGMIPTNDACLDIDEKRNISVLGYINYLVNCMSNATCTSAIKNSIYYLSFVETSEGTSFKITEMSKDSNQSKLATSLYSITIGYNDDIVYSFNVDNTDSWELLYEIGSTSKEYYYSIDNYGETLKTDIPSILNSSSNMNELEKNWWTQMTQFPITATLTIKGLLKPVMIMDYINIDVLFYGVKHLSSGLYAITSQIDSVSSQGFRTTLGLVRIGDN